LQTQTFPATFGAVPQTWVLFAAGTPGWQSVSAVHAVCVPQTARAQAPATQA
jgi:hypothetical protein